MFTMKRLGAVAVTTFVLCSGVGALAPPAQAVVPPVAAPMVVVAGYTVDGQTYVKWNANRALLGNPLGNKSCDGISCSQRFQKGYVIWTQKTGARIVLDDALGARYAATGWTRGFLGFPTGDAGGLSVRGGKLQHFQNGYIYWSPATGAHAVFGGIKGYYAANQYERGFLGYPTSGETAVPNGVRQDFEGGKVFWSKGRITTTTNGSIQTYYEQRGGALSFLGLPTGNKTAWKGGYSQSFGNGYVTWLPATGVQSVFGGIKGYYAANGYERGFLGYPTSGETSVPNGVRQDFQGGKVYWSKGQLFTTTNGSIQTYYEQKGGAQSALGLPMGNKTAWQGGYYQRFQGGMILWGPTTGVRSIDTGHFTTLESNFAKYGWPTGDTWKDGAGTHTRFQKGVITTNVPVAPPATPPATPPSSVYPFTSVTATATSVVLYGDSQLDGDSWSEQGARAMGFTDQASHLAYGGMGYSTASVLAGGTGWTAVQNGRMPFPGGTPGVVLVSLGGNDATSGKADAQVIADSTALWAKLKLMYPNSRIIVNGVMSRSDDSHVQRRHLDEVLAANAARQGVTFISVAGLASAANAEYLDNVHMSQEGHNAVARLYTAKLAAALGR
ncbi:GDSL-type esterase/lipase family protein [Arthrobacter sp. L77]|uniref:GDSL-type esterase/lipase family protein n=1 Tax=Arthrobacter sp. L77 TaxID=1496689 RepID=UPI00068FE5AC|nr:GDSL-type esterase/lipase family protein [Arthrobacter sp. L77]